MTDKKVRMVMVRPIILVRVINQIVLYCNFGLDESWPRHLISESLKCISKMPIVLILYLLSTRALKNKHEKKSIVDLYQTRFLANYGYK